MDELLKECNTGRSPPLAPEEFATVLAKKSFTSKNHDLPKVQALYRRAFEQRVGGYASLGYANMGWGADEAKVLSRTLHGASAAVNLYLHTNPFTDEGVVAIAAALRDGAVPLLQRLELDHCSIGDEGASALAASLRDGAATALNTLFLTHNNIGDAGVAALAACLREGGAPALKVIRLHENPASTEAVQALMGLREGLTDIKPW